MGDVAATVPAVPIDEQLAKKLAAAAKKARDGREERDRLILEAYEAGGGPREIGRLVGLTHPGVLRIVHAQQPETGE